MNWPKGLEFEAMCSAVGATGADRHNRIAARRLNNQRPVSAAGLNRWFQLLVSGPISATDFSW
jgi:hypothetical protein